MSVGSFEICKPSLTLIFNQEAWSRGEISYATNCYSYALNTPRIGWGVPGLLMAPKEGEISNENITVPQMKIYLEQDGLLPITAQEALSGKFHAIALRVSNNYDFHFYRRDRNGRWSHKNGHAYAKEYDDNRAPILNPMHLAPGRYTEFGGFFALPADGIRYVPRLKVPAFR